MRKLKETDSYTIRGKTYSRQEIETAMKKTEAYLTQEHNTQLADINKLTRKTYLHTIGLIIVLLLIVVYVTMLITMNINGSIATVGAKETLVHLGFIFCISALYIHQHIMVDSYLKELRTVREFLTEEIQNNSSLCYVLNILADYLEWNRNQEQTE